MVADTSVPQTPSQARGFSWSHDVEHGGGVALDGGRVRIPLRWILEAGAELRVTDSTLSSIVNGLATILMFVFIDLRCR